MAPEEKKDPCARILITIEPMPSRASEEFHIRTHSLNPDFEVDDEPSVLGQCPRNGGQFLRLSLAVWPRGSGPKSQDPVANVLLNSRPVSLR